MLKPRVRLPMHLPLYHSKAYFSYSQFSRPVKILCKEIFLTSTFPQPAPYGPLIWSIFENALKKAIILKNTILAVFGIY